MGKMHGTKFIGTPESAVFTHTPWLGPGNIYPYDGLGTHIDRQDRSVAPNDPWSAKAHERLGLKVLTRLVLGEVGWGKSTDVKSEVMDLSSITMGSYEPVIDLHDKRLEHDVEIVDPDRDDDEAEPGPLKKLERVGEWFLVGEWLDNNQIDVSKIESNCFDPLVIKKGHQIIDIAQELAYFGNQQTPIPAEWLFYYHVAAFIMMRDYPDLANPLLFERLLVNLTLQDVRDYYKEAFSTPVMGFDEYFGDSTLQHLKPEEQQRRLAARARVAPDRMNHFSNITEEHIKATAWHASVPFDHLIRGSDGKLLGQHSFVSIMQQGSSCPSIRRLGNTYNWANMTRRGISLQKALMSKFRVIDRSTPGGGLLSPDIEVEDEDHSNWQDLVHARWKTEERKYGRQELTYSIQLSHRLGDYLGVGTAGSEQRTLAAKFLEEVTMKTIFHQRGSQTNRDHLETVWGLEPELVEYTVSQKTGESVSIIGEQPPHRNALPLSEIERVVSFTENALNRGLNRRRALWGKERQHAIAQNS